MIPMLMKTFDIGMVAATELLNRVVRDTAIDIKAAKLDFAKDRRARADLELGASASGPNISLTQAVGSLKSESWPFTRSRGHN